MRVVLFIVISFFVSGCIMSSSAVSVSKLLDRELGIKNVTVIDNFYSAEVESALISNGFTVTPMPSQQQLISLQSGVYDGEATRWAVRLDAREYGGYVCVTSNSNIMDFTLSVKDLADNRTVMRLQQNGSDGPCGTIMPVFNSLAVKLSENWK